MIGFRSNKINLFLLCIAFTVLFFTPFVYAGIEEVYWDPITASNGEEVRLYARMSDSSYNGQNVEFEIYEYDPFNPDYITTQYATIDGSFAESSWTAIWQSDPGRPEFRFTFKVPSDSLEEDCENELHVSQDSETKYYAVCIGENAYLPSWSDDGFPALTFSIQAATDFYNTVNFPGETHKVLLENATKSEIKNAIDNYKNMMDEGDMFVFYYAGHGNMNEDGSTYWLVPPEDISEPDTDYFIEHRELYDWLTDLPTSRIAVVLITQVSHP